MRRIFTSTIFIALTCLSFKSFSQTCSVSTTNPNPTPPFTSAVTVSSSTGFSSTNQTTVGQFPKGATSNLKSPVYRYSSSQSTIYFKYHLEAASSPNATISGYSIAILYGTGGSSVISCSGSSIGTINTSGNDFYFSISPLTPFPAGTDFQILLSLALTGGSNDRDIVASSFQTNALATGAATLPVKFSSLDARTINNSVSLKWNVATEDNVSGYEIERSADGRNYSKIGFVSAGGESSYSFVDTKALSIAYYRIKSVDINGRYGYSTVAMVKAGKSMIILKAFPTPFIKNVSIQHPTAAAGSAITVNSEDGRIVKSIIPAVGTQQTDIDLSAAKAGVYLVRYVSGNGEVETLKILKQQ